MKRLAIVISLIATSAYAGVADFSAADRKAAAASIKLSRKGLDAAMFDYPSARFRAVRVGQLNANKAVRICGFVNGKNRNGAYVGWQPFFAFNEDVTINNAMLFDVFCKPDDDQMTFDTKDYSEDISYKGS